MTVQDAPELAEMIDARLHDSAAPARTAIIAEIITSALTAAYAAGVEDAAKVQCEGCRDGVPATWVGDQLQHIENITPRALYVRCSAAAITAAYARVAELEPMVTGLVADKARLTMAINAARDEIEDKNYNAAYIVLKTAAAAKGDR